jgi:hypothetical protein
MPPQDVLRRDLVGRLFVPQERWGWEFVDPGAARPSPLAGREPVWVEPPGPDLREIEERRQQAKQDMTRKAGIVALASLVSLGALTDGGWVLLLVAAGLACYWFAPILQANQKIAAAQAEAAKRRTSARARFEREHGDWHQRVGSHDRAEQLRLERETRYYPLELQGQPSRVDVFGGTSVGWAALLVTAGSAALASGQRLLVLDFSQDDVTDELAALARQRGHAVRQHTLPGELRALRLLDALNAEEWSGLLARAVHSASTAPDVAERRASTAGLLRCVVECLDSPITFGRIAAGLNVLQRTYGRRDDLLTRDEESALADRVDLVGQSERAKDDLRFLVGAVERLARLETGSDGAAPPPLDPKVALTVLATSPDVDDDLKAIADAVVFQAILHHVRVNSPTVSNALLVVVGADQLGKDALESMARQARRRGVRLVYLLEHLRGDLRDLLGGDNSATLLMRLGNDQEAGRAAEFIGRGHKFVLGQITRGSGVTDTVGGGTSSGVTDTLSESKGTSENSGVTGSSTGYTHAVSRSRATSWSENESWSQARSTNRGTTDTRVYEFVVEPTTLQSLPLTAFLLVDTGPAGRRVQAGDANPGYCLLDNVSDTARPIRSVPTGGSTPLLMGHGGLPPQRHGTAGPDVAAEVSIVDPNGEQAPLADRIRSLGYVVDYQHAGAMGQTSGRWVVRRGDGRPLDAVDNQRIQEALAAHSAWGR